MSERQPPRIFVPAAFERIFTPEDFTYEDRYNEPVVWNGVFYRRDESATINLILPTWPAKMDQRYPFERMRERGTERKSA